MTTQTQRLLQVSRHATPEGTYQAGIYDAASGNCRDIAIVSSCVEDANLFAAAPDMYAALTRFAKAIQEGSYPELQGIACDAFQALEKAEGK